MAFQALIASSEDSLVERFSAALGEMGLKVETVPHTGRALSILSSRRFEAVLLDCDLEGGMELVEVIRREPTNQRALVFAFVNSAEAARSANQNGANFVLAKPINWESAKRILRAAHTMIIRERRRCIREKVRVAARVMLDDRNLDATVCDLSDGGLALRTTASLPIGTTIEVQFTLPGSSELVHCTAIVAWNSGDLIGVEFSYVPPPSANVIVRWLDRHSPRRVQRGKNVSPANQALSWGF